MSGFNYLDLYFDFQDLFKSVKDYDSLEEVIKDAMRYLVNVLHNQKKNKNSGARQSFVDAIKLVYFNYFSPHQDGGNDYEPINGRFIYLRDNSGNDNEEDLKQRVCQHMSYYVSAATESKRFIRISRALIESNTANNIRDFFVQRKNESFVLFLNEDLDKPISVGVLADYPIDFDADRIKGRLTPSSSKPKVPFTFEFDPHSGMSEMKHDSDASKDWEKKGFEVAFANPLSAHLILLKKCSLLYVYSQSAQVGRNDRSIGYGGIFALIDHSIEQENDIKDYIHFFRMISDSVSTCIAHNIMREKLIKEANKSAKAAIMSRNMSHNLGSHVMAYLKQHMSSVTSMLDNNVFSDMVPTSRYEDFQRAIDKHNGKNLKIGVYEEVDNNKGRGLLFFQKRGKQPIIVKELLPVCEKERIALPFLVGLGNFFSYLQERQDFIATIATDYIPYYSTVNFKDFVYDELNPDKRYLRHKDRRNLKPDNILLGNIARSEGLGREISPTEKDKGKLSDIVIKFRDFDGNPVEKETPAYNSLQAMRDLDISLPGGVVGRQAIFSIVENIVRNAAKHGNWRHAGKLELTFDFIDKDRITQFGQLVLKKRLLELALNNDDNSVAWQKISELKEHFGDAVGGLFEDIKKKEPNLIKEELAVINGEMSGDAVTDLNGKKHLSLLGALWLFYSKAVDYNDFYIVTLTDNIETDIKTQEALRKALTEDYTKDGVMREGNKGIKELRISAAWIRGAKDESEYYIPNDRVKIRYPQDNKKAPLMYVRLVGTGSNSHKGYLQYIFCLPIPKRIAIVTNQIQEQAINDYNLKLSSKGSAIYTAAQFKREKNRSYSFVLCDDENAYKQVRPFSVAKTTLITSIPDLQKLDIPKLIDKILEDINQVESPLCAFFSQMADSDSNKDQICIDDEKTYYSVEQKCNLDPSYKAIVSNFKEDGFDYYQVGNIIVTKGGGRGKYIYRTHHDSSNAFNSFMATLKPRFNGCNFVESITGDSSTDRLVRNNRLDDLWYYSHLRAMKLKVAVLDERLFAKIYGLEEVSFTRGNAPSGTFDQIKDAYCKLFPGIKNEIAKYDSLDELNTFITSNVSRRKELHIDETYSKGKSVITSFQKGIVVFTLIKDPLYNSKYGLYGVKISAIDDVMDGISFKDDSYSALCGKLATLSWDSKTMKLTMDYEVGLKKLNVFDYISIHQGLLDKLYEAFDIKGDATAKEQFTQQLYLELHKERSSEIINLEDTDESGRPKAKHQYLAGMIIHSGRSRPNLEDMPQMLPFIQFASIEHAVLDCKYSLVELLDNARYD